MADHALDPDLPAQLEAVAHMAAVSGLHIENKRVMPAAGVADTIYEAKFRIEELEAKLAVAVEALEDALNRMEEDRASGDCGNWDWVDGDVYSRGRAALAEIKGEK